MQTGKLRSHRQTSAATAMVMLFSSPAMAATLTMRQPLRADGMSLVQYYNTPQYQPQYQQQQTRRPQSGASDAELRARIMLLQRSMGFGGIFAPAIKGMLSGQGGSRGSSSSSGNGGCGQYTDYAACQAHKSGNGWAADRLQNQESDGAERDWYNR